MPTREIKNPSQFRSNVCKQLEKYFTSPQSTNIEKGVFNWCIKECKNKKIIRKWENPIFVQMYIDHLRSIFYNLQDGHLISLVNSGEIKSHEIAFMTHQEMNRDKWDELLQAKSIRDKNKFEQNLEAMTDRFTCRKCFSKKCSYYALQTRSADEPMTLYITCLECGARMKK
jgi:DNA-directed RNA polymerase subunit M/transcription elongation factor TFIIS